METKKFLLSRTEETADNNNLIIRKLMRQWGHVWSVMVALRFYLLLAITTLIYYLLGDLLQHLDPTVGWLDIGSLSLSLFAAWSCLLGVGITGLLPVIFGIVGRKGGMEKWGANNNYLWQAVIYAGYIALLCALL